MMDSNAMAIAMLVLHGVILVVSVIVLGYTLRIFKFLNLFFQELSKLSRK